MNTYLWMNATANSSKISIVRNGMDKKNMKLNFSEISLRRDNNKCPAIILADKRTANVNGRIRLLVVSIITIKEARARGVFIGTRWENMWLDLISQPKIINDIHLGKDKERLKVKWLVEVKIYGNKPSELLKKIIQNKEKNIIIIFFLKWEILFIISELI